MLTKNTQINRDQVVMIALDQLVPADHLVRKMDAAVDFSFIYSKVEDLYSTEIDLEQPKIGIKNLTQ